MANKVAVDADARARLLAASLDLFTSKGYAATSVREIVAGAGVSKPVLYYYFGNKEGIYLELMHDTYVKLEDIVSRISASPGTAVARIHFFAAGIFDAFIENLQVVRLIYSIFFGPPQGAPPYPHHKFFDVMIEVVTNLVRQGIHEAEFDPVDEKKAAWVIVSCLNTVMEEQLCHDPPRIDREELLQMINLFLDGIVRGGTK